MFDIEEFIRLSVPVAGFLIPIILGLVDTLAKTFPVIEGKWKFLSSLVSGLVIGGSTFVVITNPVNASQWFACVLFGLICGLTASGTYNVLKTSAAKGVDEARAEECKELPQ